MPRLRKLMPPKRLLSTPINIYEVDGIVLSEEEVNLANILLDKLGRETNGLIDFKRASKWRLRHTQTKKN